MMQFTNDAASQLDCPHVRIGDWSLDLRFRRVTRDGESFDISQRAFDLLLLFIRDPHRLHTRSSIFEKIWLDVVVEDANLTQIIWILRKALGQERKQWIKTVAKRGFVFEPPHEIEYLDLACGASLVDLSNVNDPDEIHVGLDDQVVRRETHGTPVGFHGWDRIRHLVRHMALAIVCLTVGASMHQSAQSEIDAGAKLGRSTVAYIHLRTTANGKRIGSEEWPLTLLEESVMSALEMTPNLVEMSTPKPGRSLTDPSYSIELMVEKGSMKAADGISMIAKIKPLNLAAEYALMGKDTIVVVPGRRDDAAGMSARACKRVLALIHSEKATGSCQWLALDSEGARAYASSMRAYRLRDWKRFLSEAERLVSELPDLLPLRAKMAEAYFRSGETSLASRHIDAAMNWKVTAAPGAMRILTAMRSRYDPRRQADALEEFCELSEQFPQRPDFSINCISLMSRMGMYRQAETKLSSVVIDPSVVPKEILLRRDIIMSEVASGMGDSAASLLRAQDALSAAIRLGDGWEKERAMARMMIAHLQSRVGSPQSFRLYELASLDFKAAGNETDALLANVHAELISAAKSDMPSPALQSLLHRAKALGNSKLEVNILRMAADVSHAAGKPERYRALLNSAIEIANDSGDSDARSELEYDLLYDDLNRGHLHSAVERSGRLLSSDISGEMAVHVIQMFATASFFRGQYDDAVGILKRVAGSGVANPSESIYCLYAEIHIAKGMLSDARGDARRCYESKDGDVRLRARMLVSKIDIMDGNVAQARLDVDIFLEEIDNIGPGYVRSVRAVEVSELLLSLGDFDRAERCLRSIAQPDDSTYNLLLSDIDVALAEVAAARRDWPLSRTYMQNALARIPEDVWIFSSRADLLEAIEAESLGKSVEAEALFYALQNRAMEHGDQGTLSRLSRMRARSRGYWPPRNDQPLAAVSR